MSSNQLVHLNPTMVRKRAPKSIPSKSAQRGSTTAMSEPNDPHQVLLGQKSATTSSQRPRTADFGAEEENTVKMENLSRKSQWIVLAMASGACAAFNGVFAKLTTTELTTTFATRIANLIGLAKVEGGVEVVVRAIFFLLNLLFNGIMWTLFTKALARGTSTTQVSILNTSANFMITAVLGFVIFSESLPPLWFLGAALLVAGNVIIGRREEGESKTDTEVEESERDRRTYGEEREEDGLLGEEVEFEDLEESESERKREQEEQDILHLDLEGDERRNDVQLLY